MTGCLTLKILKKIEIERLNLEIMLNAKRSRLKKLIEICSQKDIVKFNQELIKIYSSS